MTEIPPGRSASTIHNEGIHLLPLATEYRMMTHTLVAGKVADVPGWENVKLALNLQIDKSLESNKKPAPKAP